MSDTRTTLASRASLTMTEATRATPTPPDYAALLAEREALRAEVERLRKRTVDGYWFTDDREYGHSEIDDLLEDADQSDIISVTPWSCLPEVFYAWIRDEDNSGWREFPTMDAARQALGRTA
jgi:hypothetical protein